MPFSIIYFATLVEKMFTQECEFVQTCLVFAHKSSCQMGEQSVVKLAYEMAYLPDFIFVPTDWQYVAVLCSFYVGAVLPRPDCSLFRFLGLFAGD